MGYVHGLARLTVTVTYLHALESEAWLTLTSGMTLGDLLTSLNLSLLSSCFYTSYDSGKESGDNVQKCVVVF